MSKISITPIGTCRINTPLKRGAARYPIRLDYQRIFGFVHTSEEALQQLMYRIGERRFPSEVVPIMFRPGMDCDTEGPTQNQSDLTIVEISSGKTYLVDDVAVQSNYLSRYFADFFAAPRRARAFWDLARRGDPALVQAFVERDKAAQLYSAHDRAILSKLKLHIQTFEDVFDDMAKITEILGRDRVLFVTHVNAATPDGNVIANRDKLIRWVRLAAQRLGTECFDPTHLMEEFGQERAMEREGLDLTHYTNAFCDRWFGRIHRDFVVGRMVDGGFQLEGSGSGDTDLVVENVAFAMANEDFFEGSRQLFAALKSHPDNVALRLLYGEVLEKIGDFDGALKILEGLVGSPEMTADVRQSYARVLLETGDAAGALATAGQLLADEYENDEIYAIAGSAAEKLGDQEAAQRYRKVAFRLDPSNHAAAISVLAHYHAEGRGDLYSAWLDELFEVLESRADARLAQAIGHWAMARQDHALLGKVLLIVARDQIGLVFAVIEEAIQFDMALDLLDSAPIVAGIPDLPGKAQRALNLLAQAWAEAAQRAMVQGDLGQAHRLARSSIGLMPANSMARRTERACVVALLEQLRAAPDEAAILALAASVGDMIYERRAMASLVARALINQHRLEEAQAVARRIYALEPEDIEVRAEYALISASTGDFTAALAMYGDLAHEPAARVERHAIRIGRFLATAAQKGLRRARMLGAEGRFDEAIALLRLLDRHVPDKDRLASELTRMFGVMRVRIRTLHEAGGEALCAVLPVLQTLLANDLSDAPAQLGTRHVRALLADARFEEAIETARLLEARTDLSAVRAQQLEQIRSGLRVALRKVEAADDIDSRAALRLLRLSLGIAPDDLAMLRRAASEAMHLRSADDSAAFAEVHDLLARLLALDPREASVQLLIRHVRVLTGECYFEHAIALVRLLAKMPGMEDRQAAELGRIRSALRHALRQVDDDDTTDFSEVHRLLWLMLDIEPADASVLRRAAIEAMRTHDFELAMGLWRRLERVAPNVKSATNNIARCEIMIKRQARKARLPQVAGAMAA